MLQVLRFGQDAFAVTLCADSKLRFWSLSRQSLVLTADVSADSVIAPRRLQLRTLLSSSGNSARVAVAVTLQQRTNCSIFNVAYSGNGSLTVEPLSSHSHSAVSLRDFQLSFTHLWQLWEDGPGSSVVRSVPLAAPPAAAPKFTEVALAAVGDWSDDVAATAESADDLLDALFAPGRFTPAAAARALNALGGMVPSPPSAPALREAFRILLATRASVLLPYYVLCLPYAERVGRSEGDVARLLADVPRLVPRRARSAESIGASVQRYRRDAKAWGTRVLSAHEQRRDASAGHHRRRTRRAAAI